MVSHIKLVVGGFITGNQSWSIGVCCAPAALPNPTAVLDAFAQQAYADFLSAAWTTTTAPAQSLRSLVGSQGSVNGVRAYYYAGESTRATAVGYSTGTPQAGSGTVSQPAQVSLVCSLRTPAGGRLGGRIYLPYLTSGASAPSMTANGATTAGAAYAVANWLSLLRTRQVASTPATPIVVRNNGTYDEVISVRVDNVLDTQRRRRDKIVATTITNASLVVG